jgi:sugar phosphate isomerase/epimerase
MLDIACSTITFGMLELDEALDHVAELGFTTTEIGAVGQFCPHVDLGADPAAEGARLAAAPGTSR